ncbi:glycosyltransferase-like protein LARGE2-B, partial [Haematococcus lacustris]
MCMFMAGWSGGHAATQYPVWYRSPWPYTIQHTSLYEPWYIVDRIRNPWYDARFRGYGMDKQQQVGMQSY